MHEGNSTWARYDVILKSEMVALQWNTMLPWVRNYINHKGHYLEMRARYYASDPRSLDRKDYKGMYFHAIKDSHFGYRERRGSTTVPNVLSTNVIWACCDWILFELSWTCPEHVTNAPSTCSKHNATERVLNYMFWPKDGSSGLRTASPRQKSKI